jgi:iron complex transport system ATP-binding protein
MTTSRPAVGAAVRATDLVVRYGSVLAFESSSFEIPAGAVTAVIGPNGSGKSTVLNAVAGLVEPSSGRVDVLPVGDRPRRISLVLQSTTVSDALPVTVDEVVTMGRYAGSRRRLRREDRQAVAGAIDRMDIRPITARHFSALSGGQRQRALVAQGIAQDHDLLLLDEPMTGLDLVTMKAIDDVVHSEQAAGGTVVLTTHDLAEAHAADHVILVAGRVVASGPPAEVLTADHLLSAYGTGLLHAVGERFFVDDPTHRHDVVPHVHRGRTVSDE